MSANQQTRNRQPRKPRSDFQRLSRRFMSGVLRSLFLLNKSARFNHAGFVLPTTVLLLLVMTLTVGALSFRTASRTQSAFLAREQQVIDNIAAPAVDRGKSKLEYLFRQDTRMPGTSTPSSDVLATLMLNVDSLGAGGLGLTALGTDPYTLPDEQRIDINDDGTLDNAWSFSFDLNGDGNVDSEEVIAYSVLMDDSVDPAEVDGNPGTTATATRADDIKLEDVGDAQTIAKADNLVTRNGPINTNNSVSNCGGARAPSQGWQVVNEAALEKNFQITAFVSNGKNPGRTNSALELQQVRIAQRGNTWGAWFKYDLEIHPGPNFNWNGAMHTDGNLMVTNNLRAHMISSHNSCLYTSRASEITLAEVNNDGIDGIDISAADSQDFQGQLIAGATTYGNLNSRGNPGFHIFTNLSTAPTTNNNLTRDNDSVDGDSFDDLLDLALDPVALFTQNVSRHRRTGTWSRDTDWEGGDFRAGGRVFNQNQTPPYLDDFFRADNRYGPRPNYENYNWVTSTDDGAINTTRDEISYDKQLGEEIISTDPSADSLTNNNDGLDGYWERQSILDGMRVVVGQRLELGNEQGWNFDADADPDSTFDANNNDGSGDQLYPPQLLDPKLSNKQLQRVTLRDNLAAVQGLVVYHYATNNGQYPLACMASTAHPGTLQTLRNSRTFNINGGAPDTDFFNGVGTNGWEFSFPTAFDTEAEFGAALANDQALGGALRNLAYFAGDPNGGSPSFTPVQEAQLGNVHPFPYQSMWGDFSIARRIFDDYLDNADWRSVANPPQLTTMADRYTALSPADKSSLHSAACTLGLLAYNITDVEGDFTTVGNAGFDPLGQALRDLMDGDFTNGEIGPDSSNNLCASPGSTGCPTVAYVSGDDTTYDPDYYAQFTAEQWINALTNNSASATILQNAQLLAHRQQLQRDRGLGFIQSGTAVGLPGTGTGYTASAGTYAFQGTGTEPWSTRTFLLGCDPSTMPGNTEDSQLGLSMAFCSRAQGPKYPSLYYLFPKRNHNQVGSNESTPQPTAEEYISQLYLSNSDASTGVNNSTDVLYQVVGDDGTGAGAVNDVEDSNDTGVAAISFTPRASNRSNWSLPVGSATTGVLNPETMDIKIIDGANDNNVAVSLLDKVMYNGREEMAVRILDVDLEKLTRNRNGGGDYWISNDRETNNGIVYAVREDAAREDNITRPVSSIVGTPTTWADCDTLDELLGTVTATPPLTTAQQERCWMRPGRAVANGGPVDPPLSRRTDGSLVGLSVKPVDFAPDPDRRPNGFRLNADVSGNNGDLSDRTNRTWGLTFVTDNAAYIKGEFNPHTSDGNNSLEEFTETLADGSVGFGGAFYNDRSTSNLSSFATEASDRWRVAEVLADSVYLLSSNFVDGAIDEGFIRNRDETSPSFGNSRTSFHNQQRLLRDNNDRVGTADEWLRVDGNFGDSSNGTTATAETTSLPIWIGRNGWAKASPNSESGLRVHRDASQVSGGWFEQPNERDRGALIDSPGSERMNATIISGLVPARNRQGTGGLHNFPRFLEDWGGRNLFIQGAFLQLNFSTAGTGPFDIDAWEPGDTPEGAERIGYYAPPNRRWGYDVGLQFSPAGPIAQRFVTVGRPRSEQYRELPIDDPYVTNLRCATIPGTPSSRIFAQEEGC